MAELSIKRRRTSEGFIILLSCTKCPSWEKQADAQSPLWAALVVFGEHLARRHAFQDDAIARAQAKSGYDKDVETLELPCD